ncbi:MAG: glycosyltransferase [Planctomycetota bacterium]
MTTAVHVIDETSPPDALDQLSLLAGENDRIIAIGEPPAGSALTKEFARVHCPLGVARLAGRYLRRRTTEADVLHAWSPRSATAALSARTATPVVLSLASVPQARTLKWLLRRLHKARLLCTIPTAEARERMVAAGGPEGSVRVLPPPGDPVEDATARRSRAREAMHLSPDSTLLVAPGPLVRDSGARKAIWAHGICHHAGCDVHLAVARGGAFEPHVRYFAETAGVSDKIDFTAGVLTDADVLAAADVALVLATNGRTIAAAVRALAAGLPVVATDTAGMRECVGHNRAGLLCPAGDVRSAAAAVLRLIEEADLAARLACDARTVASENHDRENCRRLLDEIYKSALAVTSA